MPHVGFGELVIILLIVLLVFGASRLPLIGEGVGKAIKNFKRGLNTDDDIEVTSKSEPAEPKRVAKKSTAKPAREEVAEEDADVVERDA